MRLSYPKPPQPGKVFRLTVSDFVGTLKLDWLIDGQLVHSSGCSDEPCYEEFRVPYVLSGTTIHLIGKDYIGTSEIDIEIAGAAPKQRIVTVDNGSKSGAMI